MNSLLLVVLANVDSITTEVIDIIDETSPANSCFRHYKHSTNLAYTYDINSGQSATYDFDISYFEGAN